MEKWARIWFVAALLFGGDASGAPNNISFPCLNHCSLEPDQEGRVNVLCNCQEKKHGSRDIFYSLKDRYPDRFKAELRRRLKGASAAEFAAVETNACAADVREARAKPRPASAFVNFVSLAQRPVCECVRNRVHFPVQIKCSQSIAGQLLCQFDLSLNYEGRGGPIREISLHDYQSCVAARINYRRPESCTGVVCHERPHECALGQQLVNVADTEACCPTFICLEEEQ